MKPIIRMCPNTRDIYCHCECWHREEKPCCFCLAETTEAVVPEGHIRHVTRVLDEEMPARRVTYEAPSIADIIAAECDALKAMLLAKNEAYGNSALDPVRIFSSADPVEQIKVRIDDKLSRLARGKAAGEDVTLDLLGYLVLLRVAERINAGGSDA